MEYKTNIYTKENSHFSYDIVVTPPHGEAISVSAYNNLDMYDHRRGGYQVFLRADDVLPQRDINKILMSIYNYHLEKFQFIFPTYVDVIFAKPFPGGGLLNATFDLHKSLYYSHYSPSFVYNDGYPLTRAIMFDGSILKLDPDQEVIFYTSIKLRNKRPCANVIAFGDEIEYLTENTLVHKTYEQIVFVVGEEYNYVSMTRNCGYFVYRDQLVIWLVSLHTIIASIDENYATNRNAMYTETPDVNVFADAMEEFNVLERIETEGDSVYALDISRRLLFFSGKFPCSKTIDGLDRAYVNAMTENIDVE